MPLEKTNSFGIHAFYNNATDHRTNDGSRVGCFLNRFSPTQKFVIASSLSVAATAFAWPLAQEWKFGAAVLGSFAVTASVVANRFFSRQHICRTAGLINDRKEMTGLNMTKTSQCKAFPTVHGEDTNLCREQLIREAKHNILISGNNCGGKALSKLLNLIEERMKELPKLKVVILSSPRFLSNQEQVEQLSKKYPTQFVFVSSPDIVHVSPGIKFSTNHTKCTVIDYGKNFILGGSGIMDNFVGTGLRNADQNPSSQEQTEIGGGFFFSQILGDFRDMDFVFENNKGNGSGRCVYNQMLLLCRRWEAYNQATGTPSTITPRDSIIEQLFKERKKIRPIDNSPSKAFELRAKKSGAATFRLFASGPEQTNNSFPSELIKSIDTASKEIVINHMYFHPSQELTEALIRAAKKGVKITIITGGRTKGCPKANYFFAPRNKYNYAYLVNSLPAHLKSNVHVYEFDQHNVGLHKKVIVVDDIVIGGSSNISYKSLTKFSDHELNFIAKSEKLAEETLKVCQIDIKHSRRVHQPGVVSLYERIHAAGHRALAFWIG